MENFNANELVNKLFSAFVADVTAAVMKAVDAKLAEFESSFEDQIESKVTDAFESSDVERMVEEAVDNYDFRSAVEDSIRDYDFGHDRDFTEGVRTIVTDVVRDLEFEVHVK